MQKMMGKSANNTEKNNSPTIEKTSKTKKMNGYTCYEYNIKDGNTLVNAWFAPNVNFDYQDYLSGFTKMFSGKKSNNPIHLLNDGMGYVMKMTAYEKGEKISEMEVVSLSKTPKTITLSNYSIEKMF